MTKTLTEQIVHIQNDLDVLFDEVVKLEKRLAIATKALERIERIKVGKENNFSILIAHSYSREALKEMEGVK